MPEMHIGHYRELDGVNRSRFRVTITSWGNIGSSFWAGLQPKRSVGLGGSLELKDDLTFEEFMDRYNVSYVGKEREYREQVFHENMNRLKEQLKNGSIKGSFGVNKFAATTMDEFKKVSRQRICSTDWSVVPHRTVLRTVPSSNI